MKLRKAGPGRYNFYCPGCGFYHGFNESWKFNGDLDNPTVSPSLLSSPLRCHLFIVNGQLQYLSDCEHDLAGKTIDMKDEKDG